MKVDKRYKGKGTTIYTAWKVFNVGSCGELRPQFFSTYYRFRRREWNGPTRRPGFHAYKKRPYYPGWPFKVKKVRLKGLLGQSHYHYTAKYLWVN